MAHEAWQITSPGTLALNTLRGPIPEPGPKQVLIRIHAVSINYRDILVVNNSSAYPVVHNDKLTPCSDAAGVIEKIGEESHWKEGDEVILQPNTWLDGDVRNFALDKVLGAGKTEGVLKRWVIYDDARLVRLPSKLSLAEGATLFTAGLTAFRGVLLGPTAAQPGTTVLTQGTGGVSCFGIQIAAAAGASVIATSSSDKKLAIAKKLGATHTINYRTTPDWAQEALKLTDGKGVDFVFDVGGSGTIKQALQATRFGGSVVVVGVLTESTPTDLIPDILFGNKTIAGHLGAGSRQMFESMIDFVEKHDIHPVVAKTFRFEEAKEAFEYTSHLSEVGKVVIEC